MPFWRNEVLKIGNTIIIIIIFLGIKISKEDRQENYIKNKINTGRAITSMLNDVLWKCQITRKKQITNT